MTRFWSWVGKHNLQTNQLLHPPSPHLLHYTSVMELQHEQPAGLRAASASLTVSIVFLWIVIPAAAIFAALLFVISIIFNDTGDWAMWRRTAVPFVLCALLAEGLLLVLLISSIRTRRKLCQMLPAARKAMMVIGGAYLAIGLGVFVFPFPDPLAIFPAALGTWWLVYFSRASVRLAFKNVALAPVATTELPR